MIFPSPKISKRKGLIELIVHKTLTVSQVWIHLFSWNWHFKLSFCMAWKLKLSHCGYHFWGLCLSVRLPGPHHHHLSVLAPKILSSPNFQVQARTAGSFLILVMNGSWRQTLLSPMGPLCPQHTNLKIQDSEAVSIISAQMKHPVVTAGAISTHPPPLVLGSTTWLSFWISSPTQHCSDFLSLSGTSPTSTYPRFFSLSLSLPFHHGESLSYLQVGSKFLCTHFFF